jgi:hypothetical protein
MPNLLGRLLGTAVTALSYAVAPVFWLAAKLELLRK